MLQWSSFCEVKSINTHGLKETRCVKAGSVCRSATKSVKRSSTGSTMVQMVHGTMVDLFLEQTSCRPIAKTMFP